VSAFTVKDRLGERGRVRGGDFGSEGGPVIFLMKRGDLMGD
jgi:hypothetical protein